MKINIEGEAVKKFVLLALLAMLLMVGLASPASAYTRPAALPRPTSTVHWVYNCHSTPTVEITLKNVSGPKDVYVHNDTGYTLIAQNVTFSSATVYDGLYRINYLMQTNVFLTAAGVGPYNEDSRIAESSVSTPPCTEYNDVPYVTPTPPPGSVDPGFTWIAGFVNN